MSATRLHKVSAVYLAVMYGVVGFTGESLHYLVTDPLGIWAGCSSVRPAGFYHVHAPDHHWHFHRHSHRGHHHHEEKIAGAEQETDETAVTAQRVAHEPHGCPLLALVSLLKLGHGEGATRHIFLQPLAACSIERFAFGRFVVASTLFARGPPPCAVA
jgi:hypothetical protein